MTIEGDVPQREAPRPGCRVCGSETAFAARVQGEYSKRNYELGRCEACGYAFVINPWLDHGRVYDDAYYEGNGADSLVDYRFELEQPDRTIRGYEWRGIAEVVRGLIGELAGRRWLDYGSGNGGLVRYLREKSAVDAFGFDPATISEHARARHIPVLEEVELSGAAGSFDVVSAIEVLEHTPDPVNELRRMRRLLRPGGLVFLTTGNLRTHAADLSSWSYVKPDIHISFFEPRTLEIAMAAADLRAEHRSLGPGFDEILTYKVLKTLRVRRRSILTDALPRRLVGALGDRVAHLREHPIAWAPRASSGSGPR
jgi:SAM-dependent methyltransferase